MPVRCLDWSRPSQAFSSFVHGSRTRGADVNADPPVRRTRIFYLGLRRASSWTRLDAQVKNIPNSHLRAVDGDFVVCPLLRACRPSTQDHTITRQWTPRGGRVFGGRDARGDGRAGRQGRPTLHFKTRSTLSSPLHSARIRHTLVWSDSLFTQAAQDRPRCCRQGLASSAPSLRLTL